jgi:hypothetical protein
MLRHFERQAPRADAERPRRRRRGEQTQGSTAPLYYDDGSVIHACWSASVDPEVGSVRTKCDAHVPGHEAFTLENVAIDVTCPRCRAVAI